MHKLRLDSLVLGEVLRRQAAQHRAKDFLRFRDGTYSYREVHQMANRVAQGLLGIGVRPGDHVAVMLPNGPEIVFFVFALARIGAVAVPVNTAYRGELLRHILATSDV